MLPTQYTSILNTLNFYANAGTTFYNFYLIKIMQHVAQKCCIKQKIVTKGVQMLQVMLSKTTIFWNSIVFKGHLKKIRILLRGLVLKSETVITEEQILIQI